MSYNDEYPDHAESRCLVNKLIAAIKNERNEDFRLLLEKYKTLLSSNCRTSVQMLRNLCDSFYNIFRESLQSSSSYYALQLYDVWKLFPPVRTHNNSPLHIALEEANKFIAHQLILHGADVNYLNVMCCTPLEEAVRSDSLELVCMLLYYGAYTNNFPDNITSFMYAMICKSDEAIQRVLMEFENDFNLCVDNTSTLFFAIEHRSPLILELIERGADVNYYNDNHDNAISLAVKHSCEPEVFQVLWNKFDYSIWTECCNTSVLMNILSSCCNLYRAEYCKIVLENEEKLILDIVHHDNYNRESSLVLNGYIKGMELQKESEDVIESYILHLLSYGANIFSSDLDEMYYWSSDHSREFFKLLLYMDLKHRDSQTCRISTMYFQYTPVPDDRKFLSIICRKPVTMNMMSVLYCAAEFSMFFALDEIRFFDLLDECTDSEFISVSTAFFIYAIFNKFRPFPSLLQLARDATRKAICSKYKIRNSCQFHTMISYSFLPKALKDLLTFNTKIYDIPCDTYLSLSKR